MGFKSIIYEKQFSENIVMILFIHLVFPLIL